MKVKYNMLHMYIEYLTEKHHNKDTKPKSTVTMTMLFD